MTKQEIQTRLKYILPLLGILFVIGIFIYRRYKEPQEGIRGAIAELLGINEDYIQMNLPPADGRYPGTILLRPPTGSPLVVYREEYKPELQANVPTSDAVVTSKLTQTGQFEFGLDPFSGNTKSSGDFEVTVELSKIRIIEYPGGIPALRNKLFTNNDVKRQRQRNQNPEVVVRAIEALPLFFVKKGANISAEAWQSKVKELNSKVGSTLEDNGSIRISTPIPVVVAYETQLVSFVTDQMAPGVPSKVILEPVLAKKESTIFTWLNLKNIKGKGKSPRIGHMTIGTSKYNHPELGDLPAVDNSLKSVIECFNALGSQSISRNTFSKRRWTKTELVKAVENMVKEAEAEKLDGIILYYIGHSAYASVGGTYLFMSDFDGPIETWTKGSADAPYDELIDSSPMDPEDIEGFQAGSVDAGPVPKTLNITEISEILKKIEIPFVILVDGCAVRNTSSEFGYYLNMGDFGSDENSVGSALNAQQHWTVIPALQEENIVILTQRPGKTALAIKHPFWQSKGPDVGPLTSSIFKSTVRQDLNGNYNSWGDFFMALVDFAGRDDWGKLGSVSWSEFGTWQEFQFPNINN